MCLDFGLDPEVCGVHTHTQTHMHFKSFLVSSNKQHELVYKKISGIFKYNFIEIDIEKNGQVISM